MNRNHFGTLMILGLGAGGVLCLERERRPPGPVLLAIQLGLALCIGALLASQSRAALAILLVGIGACVGLLFLMLELLWRPKKSSGKPSEQQLHPFFIGAAVDSVNHLRRLDTLVTLVHL